VKRNEADGTDADEAPETHGVGDESLPRMDFAMFVMSLNHSALVHLGATSNPETGRIESNLPLARQTIDLITMLEEKTRGNLSGEEERLVGQVLFELRMHYVELQKAK
jgi:hypothetical protein